MEFKGPIPYPGKSDIEDRAECALDIAQFANGSGGVLVIGAEEKNHVFQALVAVKDPQRCQDWIRDVITGQLKPVPAFEPLLIWVDSATPCLVINVPPHPTLVARYRDKKYQFVVRAGWRPIHLRPLRCREDLALETPAGDVGERRRGLAGDAELGAQRAPSSRPRAGGREEHAIDFCVVKCEKAAGGFGVTAAMATTRLASHARR